MGRRSARKVPQSSRGAPAGAVQPRPSGRRPYPLWPGLAAAALVGFVYLAVASGGDLRFEQSGFPHHVLIADAWLHGQFNVRGEVLEARSEPYFRRYRQQLERKYEAEGRELSEAEWDRIRPKLKTKALHDWALIDGKYYGYWGPTPAALLLPYVAVAGIDASDRLASCLVGTATVLLTALMLGEVARLGFLPIAPPAAFALAVLLGLGTVHFYLSVMGQVWFLSQVVATFFLTLAAWAALRSDRGARWTALSGAAFGAAFLSRSSVAATLGFFPLAILAVAAREFGPISRSSRVAAITSAAYRGTPSAQVIDGAPRYAPERTGLLGANGNASRNALPWVSAWLRLFAPFVLPLVFAGAVALAYNHVRFGSAFDTGVTAQTQTGANPRFKGDYETYGPFSLHYLPRNLYYYFLNPTLRRHPKTGSLTFDPNGNSMFLVTPAFLYLLVAWRPWNALTRAAWVGAGPCLAMLLVFFGTGWFNFGNRYLLDLLPFAILLVAVGMRGRLTRVSALLIALSILVNAWGTYRFSVEQF